MDNSNDKMVKIIKRFALETKIDRNAYLMSKVGAIATYKMPTKDY